MLDLGRPTVSASRPPPHPGGPCRRLTVLFFRRFLENDLLSPNGDARANVGMVMALLAAPGVFGLVWLLLAYSGPFITPSERLVMALGHKHEFIAVSMLLAALAAALEWDALALDARDLAILGPLPVSSRCLLIAKLAALALFLLAFTGAVNLAPTIAFPTIWLSLVPIGALHAAWLVIVHGLIVLAAAAMGFLFVVAVRSLLLLACGTRLLRAASTLVQAALVLCLATLLLLSPMLPADVPGEIESRSTLASLSPPMWMLGLYERLTARGLYADPRLAADATWRFWERQQLRRQRNLGPEVWAHPLPLFRTEAAARRRYEGMMPMLDRLATRGALALGGIAAACAALYPLAHFRQKRREHEMLVARLGPRRQRLGRLLAGWPAAASPAPPSQAAFVFTLAALVRNGPQRLRLAGSLALGLALVIEAFIVQASGGTYLPASPTVALLALEYVLVFFLLVGMRRAFGIPAVLEASWLFRLHERTDAVHPRAGVRRAMALGIVAPLFAVLAGCHAAVWGVHAAALHAVTGVLLSLVLIEILTFRLNTIPFTRACNPGDARLRWPFYPVGLLAFAYGASGIERIALSGDTACAAVTAVLVGTIWIIRRVARGGAPEEHRLRFDAAEDEAVQTLGLARL